MSEALISLLSCFDSFKESIVEDVKLFQCFPALGTFVLELAPLKRWDALEIADHIPADQCLMALSAKVKDVSDAEQVGGAYNWFL